MAEKLTKWEQAKKDKEQAESIEKTLEKTSPPCNLDAERSVLGALFLDWDKMDIVASSLMVKDFYSKQNQIIYEHMLALYEAKTNCDILTLINALQQDGKFKEAGGYEYIPMLSGSVPTAENIEYYVKIVKDKGIRRDMIRLASEIDIYAFDYSQNVDTALEKTAQSVFELSQNSNKTKVYNIEPITQDAMDVITHNMQNTSCVTGVATGIPRLDFFTNGFQPSEFIVVRARPSIGKTAFALSLIQAIAIENKVPCAFFSLEMSHEAIAQRLLSQLSKVSCNKIRSIVSKDEYARLQEVLPKYNDAPLYIVDTPNMRLLELRSMARKLVMEDGVKIIFIDYIGLITTEDDKRPVYEVVSEISRNLKALARELAIPIVALCQVARDAEGKEPTLAQLRGSGSIEQDADVVMFLHRDRGSDEDATEGQDAKCIVAKQRNGATGIVDLLFFPLWTKFEARALYDGEE